MHKLRHIFQILEAHALTLLILVIAWLIIAHFAYRVLKKHLHIFQLNEYSSKNQLKWLWSNRSLTIWMTLSRKQKKPLVFTSRIKRLIVTSLVLELIFAVISVALLIKGNLSESYAILAITYLVVPFLPIIANAINWPLEATLRTYYINDAQKILKQHPRLKRIGITGSYGKTSIKHYLYTILNEHYNTLMTPGSFNTPLGIARTVRGELRNTDQIFIAEMGARKRGEIKELCDIVKPDIGVISSIGVSHLETFKTVDNIIKTKFELADGPNLVLINGDDQILVDNQIYYTQSTNVVTYGVTHKNDYYANNISVGENGTTFDVHRPNDQLPIRDLRTSLIGAHNVGNLVAAIAIADIEGVCETEIKIGVTRIKAAAHRLELTKSGDTIILDDAYNSNPTGAKAALEALSLFESSTKIVITPGMVELGVAQSELNEKFGAQIGEVANYAILVGKKAAEPILQGLRSANYPESQILIVDDVKEGVNAAHQFKGEFAKKVLLLENDLPDNF